MTTQAAMDSACSSTFCGLLNIHAISRRGNTNYYAVQAQHTTLGPNGTDPDSKSIDLAAIIYSEVNPFAVNDVIFASGTWIPTAEPFLSIDSHTILFRGDDDLPEAFEPHPPTILAICCVLDTKEAAGLIKTRMVDYDRRVSRRTSADVNILRVGRRWDKTAWPRVGTAIQVRGSIHSQNDVTSLFSFQADSIGFLPIDLAIEPTGTSSPKKRKFTRKTSSTCSAGDSTAPSHEDNTTPPPPEPSTPTPSTSMTSGKSKGRFRS